MQLAYQHPEVCDRLVLISSGGLGREVSWLLRVLTLPGAEQLMPLLIPRWFADRGSEASRFLRRRGLAAPRLGELWRAYTSLAGAENRKAFLRTIRTVIDTGGQTVSAIDRLYLAAHLPTLIVWGEHDAIIPVADGHVAHEAIAAAGWRSFRALATSRTPRRPSSSLQRSPSSSPPRHRPRGSGISARHLRAPAADAPASRPSTSGRSPSSATPRKALSDSGNSLRQQADAIELDESECGSRVPLVARRSAMPGNHDRHPVSGNRLGSSTDPDHRRAHRCEAVAGGGALSLPVRARPGGG